MFTLEVCADRGCAKRANCYRYNVDPTDQIRPNYIVRVEATLKRIDEDVCSKYWPIALTNRSERNTQTYEARY
jgi:hypothetical protein